MIVVHIGLQMSGPAVCMHETIETWVETCWCRTRAMVGRRYRRWVDKEAGAERRIPSFLKILKGDEHSGLSALDCFQGRNRIKQGSSIL